MKKRMRIILVYILSFTMSISAGVFSYVAGTYAAELNGNGRIENSKDSTDTDTSDDGVDSDSTDTDTSDDGVDSDSTDTDTSDDGVDSDSTDTDTSEDGVDSDSTDTDTSEDGVDSDSTDTDTSGDEVDSDKPTKPVESEDPVKPEKPTKPVEPENPVKPEKPTKPVEPENPVKPEKPTKPVEPENPVKPEKPIKPVEPENPVKPEEPTKPVEPENPVKPEEPTKPVEPEVPVKPEEPTKPVEPEDPVKPEEPTKPVEPEDPIKPTEPGIPGGPEAPTVPAPPLKIVKKVNLSAKVIADKTVMNRETLNYQISLKNSGEIDIQNIIVSDSLGRETRTEVEAGQRIIINRSFHIDRFNTFEELGNRINIIGEAEGKSVQLSLYFKTKIEIPKGSLTITNKVRGKTQGNEDFDVFIKGPQDSLHVVSLKKGQSKTIDDLWLGDYTVSSTAPMNYEAGRRSASVEITNSNRNKSQSINHIRNNDKWFYNHSSETVIGKRITEIKSKPEINRYRFDGSENLSDNISFEIIRYEESELPEMPEENEIENPKDNEGPGEPKEEPLKPEENGKSEESKEPSESEKPKQPEVIIPDDPVEKPSDKNKEDESKPNEKTKEPEKNKEQEEIKEPEKAIKPDEIESSKEVE